MNLPKLTMSLQKKLEAPRDAVNAEARYKAMYSFLKDVIASEELVEALSGTSIQDIDVIALERLYHEVVTEYERPIREAEQALIAERLSSLESVDFEKIARVTETLKKYGK